ncbi:MAG: hypothetical protein KDD56_02000 [Bdellovibrionales bacterium]|nr:hypothetical protein [Bdellovibrionales bacterium]
MKKYFSLLFISSLIYQNAFADIYFCNGVWTNTSCENEPEKVITSNEDSKTSEINNEEHKILSKKKSLLHNLASLKFKLEREYGGNFSINSAERVCQDPASSLEECERAIDAAEKNLLDKQLALSKLKQNESESENEPTESSGDTVVIQQNTDSRIGFFENDKPRQPSIINGTVVPPGETQLDISPKRKIENTLVEQQRKASRKKIDQ